MDVPIRGDRPRESRGRPQPATGARPQQRPRGPLPYAWGVYFALGLAFLVSLTVTLAWKDNDVVQRFGPNFTSELLGIIVTLAFVQRMLARDERARKLRAAVGPLRKGRLALGAFVDGWSTLLKGAFDPRRTELPRTIEQLFTAEYTEDIACLDPLAHGPEGPADAARPSWTEEGVRRLVEAQARLREIIATYGASLDPEYLEAIDELADDAFVLRLRDLARRVGSAQEWRVAVNQSRGYRESHFVRLNHALALHNRLAQEAARFRSRHLAPTAGSLSLQLRADSDLAIPTRIGPEWWTSAPTVGALRAP